VLFFPKPSISGRALIHFKVPRPCYLSFRYQQLEEEYAYEALI
jgi:hypothetical protein